MYIMLGERFSNKSEKNYKASSHCRIPSLREGLALCMTKEKVSLNMEMHKSILSWPPSNMILFLWFQILHHPIIRYSLKQIWPDLLLPSRSMSVSSMSMFHSWLSLHQKIWLDSHPKNKWCIDSMVVSEHSTHDVSSKWKFFLVRRSLVFSLS